MTLGPLCAAAIEQVTTRLAIFLLDAIDGPAGLTNFARNLGDNVTRLDRKEPGIDSGHSRRRTRHDKSGGDVRRHARVFWQGVIRIFTTPARRLVAA